MWSEFTETSVICDLRFAIAWSSKSRTQERVDTNHEIENRKSKIENPMTNTEFRTGVINPIECVKEGFERIKKDYWLLFAIGLVGGLIGGFTMYVLAGAMICGIMFAYLKAIDGKPIVFDELWKRVN